MAIIPLPSRENASDDEKEKFWYKLYFYLKNMAVDKLNQTVSAGYVQAEVQAISNKVDELIGKINKTE
tara:strand:+ start:351 stop:554 length:204 start_codon:yes stop_codon:yes gene_type:complete